MAAPEKILIVGANGFLASYLAPSFYKRSNQVVGLINQSDHRIQKKYFKSIYQSYTDLFVNENYFDMIFLLASYIPINRETPDKRLIKSNIDLVSEISRKYPESRIIFSSSTSVYGTPQNPPLTEKSPFNNPDLYGLSKIAGETIIKNHRSYGILRFSSIWGTGMKENTFIPRLFRQAEKGKIEIWGEGSRKQNYIYVEDAVEMCKRASLVDDNLTLLAVAPKSYSNYELAKLVSTSQDCNMIFTGKDSSSSFVFDAAQSYQALNYTPLVDIKEQLFDLKLLNNE